MLSTVAAAAPSASDVEALARRANQLGAEYDAQARQVGAARTRIATQSNRLEQLLAKQEQLQSRLNARAGGMYRTGRLSFIDVLTSSATFAEFSSRWELLTRMNRDDAITLLKLKIAKRQTAATAARLLAEQERASARMRALEARLAAARRELGASRSALAAFEASRRAAERAAAGASAPAPRSGSAPTPRGSGAWQSAVASHYGPGSYGHRTADGTVVRPDSMIVAHKTLPFGTLVEFEYKGRTAVARVADRGPYVAGRTWDLGPGVIRILDFNGVHQVRYRIVSR